MSNLEREAIFKAERDAVAADPIAREIGRTVLTRSANTTLAQIIGARGVLDVADSVRQVRFRRQKALADWAQACFGEAEATNPKQRALRFLEETVELCQSLNLDKAKAHELVDFVYSRPVGDPTQELGGCGVTLALVAESIGADADEEERRETARVLALSPEYFAKRNQAKNDAGMKVDA